MIGQDWRGLKKCSEQPYTYKGPKNLQIQITMKSDNKLLISEILSHYNIDINSKVGIVDDLDFIAIIMECEKKYDININYDELTLIPSKSSINFLLPLHTEKITVLPTSGYFSFNDINVSNSSNISNVLLSIFKILYFDFLLDTLFAINFFSSGFSSITCVLYLYLFYCK